MRWWRVAMLSLIAAMLSAAAPGAPTIGEMRWQRRILLASAPAGDASLVAQRRIVAAMGPEAADRDLVLVEIIGDRVARAGDSAAVLRRVYRLPADRFAVVLIGRDGRVKRRAEAPIAASELVEVIDAMPMRRAGQR